LKIKKPTLKKQFTIDESRFDFQGYNTMNKEFILEVKSVPIAKYIDDYDKNLKKIDYSTFDFNQKIALFPVGFQKKKYDVISERALKHLKHLENLKKQNNELLTYICYVIQRKDVKEFQASQIDPTYKSTLKNVNENGVQIITIVVDWKANGNCIFVTDTLTVLL
jgi:DNA-binding sugar fermentation-stimulating protein